MANQDQHECNLLGNYLSCPEYRYRTCPDDDRCQALTWLEQHGFCSFKDPPEMHEYLVGPLWDANHEAYSKYPDISFTHKYDPVRCGDAPDCQMCADMDYCTDPRGVKRKPVDNEKLARKRESLIIARVRKAKEAKVRELRAQADRTMEEAAAIDASGPKGSGRFPPGWMRDVCHGIRGGKDLLKLMKLIKETAKPASSDLLLGQLVATGKWTREELSECYTDRNGVERSRPGVLFQVDYDLAERRYDWKRGKTERMLRQASRPGILWDLGKLPPENGQKVYCAGVWMTIGGVTWPNWRWTENNGGPEVFMKFRRTGEAAADVPAATGPAKQKECPEFGKDHDPDDPACAKCKRSGECREAVCLFRPKGKL